MKKTLEAVLVVSVAVLTVSTTASLIHNQSKKHAALAKTIQTSMAKTSQTAKQENLNHQTAHSKAGEPSTTGSVNSSNTAVPAATSSISQAAPSDSGIVQNWSAEDTQRFLTITQKLVHSLTREDWNSIEQALSQGSEKRAQIVLMTTAHKYLTPSDETWVATHLAGTKPFGPVDVALLQQAFKQLQGQLTPFEQQLLQENHLL